MHIDGVICAGALSFMHLSSLMALQGFNALSLQSGLQLM